MSQKLYFGTEKRISYRDGKVLPSKRTSAAYEHLFLHNRQAQQRAMYDFLRSTAFEDQMVPSHKVKG